MEKKKMVEKKRIIRIMFAKIKPAFFKLSGEEQQEFQCKDREKMEEEEEQAAYEPIYEGWLEQQTYEDDIQ